MADETPVKRGPGRPRRSDPEIVSETKKSEVKSDPDDPRIGQSVEDENTLGISFADGSEYWCKDGVITERVH